MDIPVHGIDQSVHDGCQSECIDLSERKQHPLIVFPCMCTGRSFQYFDGTGCIRCDLAKSTKHYDHGGCGFDRVELQNFVDLHFSFMKV